MSFIQKLKDACYIFKVFVLKRCRLEHLRSDSNGCELKYCSLSGYKIKKNHKTLVGDAKEV